MVTLAEVLQLSPLDAEAFVEFEELCRARMERALQNLSRDDSAWPHQLEYMSRVSQAALEYGVDPDRTLQKPGNAKYSVNDYDGFIQGVFGIVTRSQIQTARVASKNSTELEETDKRKLAFHISKLREQVANAVDLTDERKKALYKKLDELLEEIEKPRVNLAKMMVILAATAGLIASAQTILIKGPETFVAIMDAISIATAKEQERQALFERYRKPLAIEDQSSNESESERFVADLDDEIPF